jgi:predicted nucleic acid-binding protein
VVVVADTSPINYLVLIAEIDLLPQLYERILIPPAVLAELKHPLAPKAVQEWVGRAPEWLEVLSPSGSLSLANLDAGESEAIALAGEVHAEVLLIDEQAGRREAVRRGLKVAGTLSILDEADQAGLVKFDESVARLRTTSFRLSMAVLAAIQQRRSRKSFERFRRRLSYIARACLAFIRMVEFPLNRLFGHRNRTAVL